MPNKNDFLCPTGNNVIAFCSGKGGVGKTFLAVSLALAFTKKEKKVLLIDGDLGLPNIDIFLGLSSKKKISDVLSGSAPLNQAIQSYNGMDLITGSSCTDVLVNLSKDKIMRMQEDILLLAHNYDTVFIDLGSGLSSDLQVLAHSSAKIIIVCSDELSSLTDAYVIMKKLSEVRNSSEIFIVINNIVSQKEGYEIFDTLLKICETNPTLLGIVQKDMRVEEIVQQQKSIFDIFSDMQVSDDILQIGDRLLCQKK